MSTTAGNVQPIWIAKGDLSKDNGTTMNQAITLAANDYTGIGANNVLVFTAGADGARGGEGPREMLVTLGYAGWAPGQLEHELAANAWLTVGADTRILFETPAAQRYDASLKLLGIDPIMLTGAAGHA